MAISSDTKRRWALATGFRAALMLIGGLYAVLAPGAALTILVTVGGVLLLIDGVIGVWSLTFGGAKTGNFWFDVVRNVLSILTGLLILLSPFLATLLTATFLIYFIAIQAIVVGIMEIVVVLRERELYARIWPVLLSGALYVLFGIALLLQPLFAATVLVALGGILMMVFSIPLFAIAWRFYQASRLTRTV